VTRHRHKGFTAALAVGEFRTLWAAEAQSIAGDQLAKVAVSVAVYTRTGSAGLTAASYAAMMLPALVSGPLLSGLADAFPRRAVMAACALLQAMLVALMALPGISTAALLALIVAVQFAQAPFMAAQAALLPVMLSGEAYQAGQALRQITRQVGLLVGLAVGGMAVATLGVSTALTIDALTFVLAAVLIRFGVRHRPAAARTAEAATTGSGPWQAALLLWRDTELRSLVALIWLAGFAVVPEALMVPFAGSVGAGPAAVGWLLAVESAAMIVGAFLLVRLGNGTRLRLVGPLAVATLLPLVGFAAAPALPAAVVLLALAGMFAAYQVTATATFMQLLPDEQRGKAYGICRSGLIASQGLGVLAGGVIADRTGSVTATIALAGAAGLLVAVPAAIGWHRTQPHSHGRHRLRHRQRALMPATAILARQLGR
jgi:predicted MFS family arabinose efflux permease